MNPTDPVILLTIDVEDWFQVENFKNCIPFSSWPSCELRVEKNVHRLLNLFDDFSNQQRVIPGNPTNPTNPSNSSNPSNPKVTFFILGWIAERLPNLVREIQARGHEVASHGYNHNLCNQQSHKDLRKDLVSSKKLLEDIIGADVYGYRAPSFSISDEILKIIQECGYQYDSSYNSFGLHGRYGKIDIDSYAKNGIAYQIPVDMNGEAALYKIEKRYYFYELPVSNLQFTIQNSKFKIINLTIPWGGGGYFRLIPSFLFRQGISSILQKHGTYVFYLHPWEIDAEQPRVKHVDKTGSFRHYVSLAKTHSRLSKILESFAECEFLSCHQYLSAKTGAVLDGNPS